MFSGGTGFDVQAGHDGAAGHDDELLGACVGDAGALPRFVAFVLEAGEAGVLPKPVEQLAALCGIGCLQAVGDTLQAQAVTVGFEREGGE